MNDWKLEPNGREVKRPVMIVVMDGVGIGRRDDGDAVFLARTPVLDALGERFISTQLKAHGTAVGLPSDDDMGNSEVGHNAIGAGRVFDQGAKLCGRAIASGKLFEGKVWRAMIDRVGAPRPANDGQRTMHFIGLLSDGNVHSHIDQLVALVRRCDSDGVRRVRLHVLLDGRDVPATSALTYVDQIEAVLGEISGKADRDYRIASGGGRMLVTMDRYEADWGMVELGWKTHVRGEGRTFASARAAIETARAEDPSKNDQYLPAFVIAGDDGKPVGPIRDGDGVVFFNFRGDRAIEISRAFEDESFAYFDRGARPDVLYAGMMQYDGDLALPKAFLVEPPDIDRTMGEYLAKNGLRQLACSETQKYGHVTYFWNGNRSGYFDKSLERYINIPSDDVPFEQRPWMKAAEITDAAIEALAEVDFARINYPNGDMVGHTGDMTAAIIGVECVDHCLGRLLRAVEKAGGIALVTADHGNSDDMFERDKKTGEPQRLEDGSIKIKTSHSLNPVPLYVCDYSGNIDYRLADIPSPGLANLAATALFLMGYEAPAGYEPSLLVPR